MAALRGAMAEGAAPAGTRRGECGGTPEPLAGVGHTQNEATDLPAGPSFTIIKAEMGEDGGCGRSLNLGGGGLV
jgi:hypothetical protein